MNQKGGGFLLHDNSFGNQDPKIDFSSFSKKNQNLSSFGNQDKQKAMSDK